MPPAPVSTWGGRSGDVASPPAIPAGGRKKENGDQGRRIEGQRLRKRAEVFSYNDPILEQIMRMILGRY